MAFEWYGVCLFAPTSSDSSSPGPIWSQVIQIATILSCLGGCTGYLIFFGETVGQALSIPANHVILISTLPLILLSWIRSFRELTVFALIGVGALVLTVLVLLYDGLEHMYASPPPNTYADPLHTSPFTHPSHSSIPMFTPHTICNFMGPATFLFTIHYIILSMGGEALQQRGWSTYHNPPLPLGHAPPPLVFSIGVSYFVSLVIIVLVGGGGFVMYRNVLQVT
ncbi:hypothetical protein EON63_01555 [archaeon]|nr:MAG: hypothetical protein EON63_01555 [archaeon]